jgi:hypothetical protein
MSGDEETIWNDLCGFNDRHLKQTSSRVFGNVSQMVHAIAILRLERDLLSSVGAFFPDVLIYLRKCLYIS